MAKIDAVPAWLEAHIQEAVAKGEAKVTYAFGGHQPATQATPTTTTTARPKTPKPKPSPTSRISLVVTISNLRLASEANAGGKLRDKIARKSEVKEAVKEAIGRAAPMLCPMTVTLTRLGGKSLDGDNLQRALKAVRDVVARWIGLDDADPGIRWQYKQEPAYRMGCRICVRERR